MLSEIDVEVSLEVYAWLLKYSEDQPRDDHGRFSAVPGAGTHPSKPDVHKPGTVKISPTKQRAFHGEPVKTKINLTNNETKAIAEAVVTQHLMKMGFKDAEEGARVVPREDWSRITGSKGGNNFPIDIYADHQAVEVKGGRISNGKTAQQWRVKYGQEPAYMKDWSNAKKLAWRSRQEDKIMQFKENGRRWLQDKCGKKVAAVTYTCIINPDTRHVDVFRFSGYHARISWMNPQALGGKYLKSYKY
jgi:hypothetical protein